MRLTFEELTLDNWKKYEDKILSSDLVFPAAMRWKPEDFVYRVTSENAIVTVAKLGSRYIGNSVIVMISQHKNLWYIPQQEEDVMYVDSIVVDPPYKRQGYGEKLFRRIVRDTKKQGIRKIVGHFREGASSGLIEKLGGQELYVEEDWCNSGEDYGYYELELK